MVRSYSAESHLVFLTLFAGIRKYYSHVSEAKIIKRKRLLQANPVISGVTVEIRHFKLSLRFSAKVISQRETVRCGTEKPTEQNDTEWNPEKLTVAQLVNIFSAFMEPQKFITMFTTSRHWILS
jgi:hypothetical protein